MLALTAVFGQIHEGHIDIADQRKQDIIEVVCKSGGKGAQGLGFLAEKKLGFQALAFFLSLNALGNIPAYTPESNNLTVFILNQRDRGFNEAGSAIFSFEFPVKGLGGLSVTKRPFKRLIDGIDIGGITEPAVVHSHQFA